MLSIGESAFSSNSIESLNIPNSVTSIGDFAFEVNKLISVNIGNSVTTIGTAAFMNNQIVSLIIPASVKSIGNSAFGYNNLSSVTFLGDAPSEGGSIFASNPNLSSIVVPADSIGFGSAFSGTQVSATGTGIHGSSPSPSPTNTPTESPSPSASPSVTPSSSPTASPSVKPVLATYKSGAKVSGLAIVGRTLTATRGSWTGTAPLVYSYQWYTCSKVNKSLIRGSKLPVGCKVISGATKSTFKLSAKQLKLNILVLITATNAAGKSKIITASIGTVK